MYIDEVLILQATCYSVCVCVCVCCQTIIPDILTIYEHIHMNFTCIFFRDEESTIEMCQYAHTFGVHGEGHMLAW